MGEVHHADDAEHHRVADGDEAIDRAERDAVDELLDEDFHASSAPSRGVPAIRQLMRTLSGRRRPATREIDGRLFVRRLGTSARGLGLTVAGRPERRIRWALRVCSGCWQCQSDPAADLGVRRPELRTLVCASPPRLRARLDRSAAFLHVDTPSECLCLHASRTGRRPAPFNMSRHEIRGRDRRQGAAVHRRGISREPARRARGLHLRRARRGRHDPSGVPQRRALDRPALRRPARSARPRTCSRWPTDTGSGGYTHKFFRAARSREELDRPARRDRRLGAHVLRLDGTLARLQGLVDEHARGQPPVLRQVLRQRAGLVPRARRRTCCS